MKLKTKPHLFTLYPVPVYLHFFLLHEYTHKHYFFFYKKMGSSYAQYFLACFFQ